MKRIAHRIVGITALLFWINVGPAPASAQVGPPGTATCYAQSNSAIQFWIGYNPNQACANAMANCIARSVPGDPCIVTRWWWN